MSDTSIINNIITIRSSDSLSLAAIANSIRNIGDGSIGADDWLQACATIIGVVLTGLILYFVNKQTLRNATNNSIRESRVTIYENWSLEIRRSLSIFITEMEQVIQSAQEYSYDLTPHIPYPIIEERAMNHLSLAGASSVMVRMFLNVNDSDYEFLNSEIQGLYRSMKPIVIEVFSQQVTRVQLEQKISEYKVKESNLMVAFDNYLTKKETLALKGASI